MVYLLYVNGEVVGVYDSYMKALDVGMFDYCGYFDIIERFCVQ